MEAYINAKGFSEMTDLSCGEGLWVNSDISQTLISSGTQSVDTSHGLGPGWNLIGLKSNQAKSVTTLISENADKIGSMWKWENNNWAVYLPGQDTETYAQSKGFSVLENINPGEGFWVNCSETIILE